MLLLDFYFYYTAIIIIIIIIIILRFCNYTARCGYIIYLNSSTPHKLPSESVGYSR